MLSMSDRSVSMKTRAMKLLDAKQDEALRFVHYIQLKKSIFRTFFPAYKMLGKVGIFRGEI
jgi:hypothetical protein